MAPKFFKIVGFRKLYRFLGNFVDFAVGKDNGFEFY